MAPSRTFTLPAALTPPVVAQAMRRRGPIVVLESGRPSAAHGEQTVVAGAPLARFEVRCGRPQLIALRGATSWPDPGTLAGAASPFHALAACVAAMAPASASPSGGGPAAGGAFGYFGYEALAPSELPRLAPFPDGWFLLTDVVVRWATPGAAPVLHAGDDALGRELADELAALASVRCATPVVAAPAESSPFLASDLDLAAYHERFAAARAALAAGDSYQLCFTYPLLRELPTSASFALWQALRRDHPAPFAAYVAAPEFALVSCSPERFVRVGADRRVEARPMKGTASKPQDSASRAQASRELADSEKVLAENLMIADLLRNDLGRVCKLGSVRASQPALVEEHATLLQLVSVIEGELAPGRTAADLLFAAFPPGSMTGAPKVRSIELLRAIEAGPRGPYSGILGWLAPDGTCDWSVVIRTALLAGDRAQVNVGGGLVWDSTARSEWEESRAKAEPLLEALAALRGTSP